MNKILRSSMILMAGAMLFAACQKDGENLVDLTAVVSDQPTSNSKVYLAGNFGYWQHGDQVMINGAEEESNKYTLSVETDGSTTAKILNVLKDANNKYTAAYPASQVSEITNGTSVTMTIPQKQTYQLQKNVYEDSADSQHVEMPMVAYSNDGSSLKFYNAASLIRLNLVNNTEKDFQIHYVTVTATSNNLSGTGTVSVAGLVENPQTLPSFSISENGDASVTLDCCATHPEVKKGENIILYLVVAPFGSNESRDQLNVTVMAEDGDNKKYTFNVDSRESGLYIERGQIGAVKVTMTAGLGTQSEFWGQGTKACPYLITSKADLIQLRNIVDYISPYNNAAYQSKYNTAERHFRQTVDIKMEDPNWGSQGTADYPIGINLYKSTLKNYPFLANYDGGGHYVELNTDLTGTDHNAGIPVALFGVIGNTSGTNYIKDLTIKGSVETTGQSRDCAGLVGYIAGNTSIIRCVNEATVSNGYVAGGGVVGGICALVGYYKVTGSSSGTYTAAGVVNFEGCVNKGAVSNASTNTSNVTSSRNAFAGTGGICGNVGNATSCTFTNCENASKGTVSTSSYYTGGLIGVATTITPSFTGINKNAGSVSASGKYYVGGIIGHVSQKITSISILSNEGSVTGSSYVGGVIGRTYKKADITNASNSGIVKSSSTQVGGIIGYTNDTVYLTACGNSDSVIGTGAVGGLVGYANKLIEIHGGSSNSGAISTSGNRVGGLVGRACDGIRFDGSVSNSGNVSASSGYFAGGFVGYSNTYVNFKASSTGTNTSDATIKGKGCVGGIAGYVTKNFWLNKNMSITNEGTVNATLYSCGGIVGHVHGSVTESDGASGYTITNTGAISGGDTTAGLFGFVFDTATLGGTTLNSNSVTGGKYTGGIVGYFRLATDLKGSHTNTGAISGSGKDYHGGIIGAFGSVVNTKAGTVIINSGNVSGAARIGGIIGGVSSTSSSTSKSGSESGAKIKLTIIGARNYGSVTGTAGYIGGIVGISELYDTATLVLRDCVNNLNGNRNNLVSGSSTYVGGILGCGRHIIITRCANHTPVSSSSQYLGGIVGGVDTKLAKSYIDTCLNTGEVSSSRSGNVESIVGGIIGLIKPSNTPSTLYIRNCVNTGDVSAPNAGSSSGSSSGGINGGLIGLINYANVTVNLNNCYSKGAISGKSYTSGLVGKCYTGKLTVNNCYFNGTVSCENASYGYALGYGTATWTNCYAVYGTETKPYSGTKAGLASGTITNCELFKTDGTFTTDGRNSTSVTVDGSTGKSILGDALRAWQMINRNAADHIAWKSDDIPTLNYTLFQ